LFFSSLVFLLPCFSPPARNTQREDVAVAQDEVRVEHYRRAPNLGWFYRTHGPGERIVLAGGAELEVDAMYARGFELPGD
jgi:hypothetical protein